MADPIGRTAPDIAMEPRLAVLELFLKDLGVSRSISTMSSRKALQKAVYLGQLAGVDLGYRFGWYIRGPYSPALAKAYYQLDEAAASGEKAGGDLKQSLREKLVALRPLMKPPANVDLVQADWLELLASWHYLRQARQLNKAAATDVIRTEKSGLLAYVDVADATLREANLLSA
jgi:hypothetical protein